mgnify:CR=1 FL=1
MGQNRKCGVLLPISSLPSKYGIGCFDKKAYEFVDALKEAGQSYWQILPLGPTSYGDSPYQSFSTFAGNPYFISLEDLIEEGVLTKKECDKVDFGEDETSVDYAKLYEGRMLLLRKAYEKSDIYMDAEFRKFQEEEAWWLKDYALFMAVKKRFGGIPWSEWAEDIRLRWQNALDYYREEMYFEIEFQEYLQFKFRQQWMKLKAYANENGIQIIGDIPIYVAMDSADTWANPWLFKLDEKNCPTQVAGCPPDAFSATGQLWGNPLYRWDYHAQTGFAWWMKRIGYCYKLYDVVRIDHFRGFDEYYSIPYGDPTAEFGKWEKGPGYALFKTMKEQIGNKPVIAEDLGFLTPSVIRLVKKTGYPGMKILQFAFDSREESDYLPHNYTANSVVYTGTHDNDTTTGWYQNLPEPQKDKIRRYCNCDGGIISLDFIRMCMGSIAKYAIFPIQDLFMQDSSCRMNTPGSAFANWAYRYEASALTQDRVDWLKSTTELFGRGRSKSL